MTLYGKHGKVRFPPIHPMVADRIHVYPERLGHQLANTEAPRFVSLRTVRGLGVTANGIYTLVETYAKRRASRWTS